MQGSGGTSFNLCDHILQDTSSSTCNVLGPLPDIVGDATNQQLPKLPVTARLNKPVDLCTIAPSITHGGSMGSELESDRQAHSKDSQSNTKQDCASIAQSPWEWVVA